jgi:hypothetical protein
MCATRFDLCAAKRESIVDRAVVDDALASAERSKANHKERFIRTGNSKRKSAREKDSSCDECVWSAVPESRAPKHDHGDESRHMPSGSNGGLQRGFGSE